MNAKSRTNKIASPKSRSYKVWFFFLGLYQIGSLPITTKNTRETGTTNSSYFRRSSSWFCTEKCCAYHPSCRSARKILSPVLKSNPKWCVWPLDLCKDCCSTAFRLGYTKIKLYVSIVEPPRIFSCFNILKTPQLSKQFTCASNGSQDKQRLFACMALTDCLS